MMKRTGKFFRVEELSHGGTNKTQRIIASLEARFEKGEIRLNRASWNTQFLDELFQFPNSHVHDDMIDSLSYIGQLTKNTVYYYDFEQEDFEIMDITAGY